MSNLIIDKQDVYADLLPLHQLNPQRYPYLLESVAQGAQNTRYSILFAFPQQQISLTAKTIDAFDFLQAFDNTWSAERHASSDIPLPFKGGWFLFLGYELTQQIEHKLNLELPLDEDLPIALATRIPAAIIMDNEERCCYFIVEEEYKQYVDALRKDFSQALRDTPTTPVRLCIENILEDDPQRYLDGVKKIKDYILAGDVFQVNLSRAWYATSQGGSDDGSVLYHQLRQANPAPFSGLLYHEDKYIISSSPERLVCVHDDYVETRPIAGTRPRGESLEQDQALSTVLRQHPKEIAEHIMLIDLERNDLGRICQPGTVEVNELMALESYRHVHHIVSNVRGRLKSSASPGDVIKATFPGGTITGCPKVRCMEIINELEQQARGAYTGAMGYVNHDGSMDLNILIRSLSLVNKQITFRAGAGIVADSNPQMELEETRAKARGLIKAIMNQLD